LGFTGAGGLEAVESDTSGLSVNSGSSYSPFPLLIYSICLKTTAASFWSEATGISYLALMSSSSQRCWS